ncbi:MAG: aspartate 1-decarboxylase [bacterium]|nr:aspartate 1-decarboxylase [bacterium]
MQRADNKIEDRRQEWGVEMILREVLKSKIQKATINKIELDYQGSIGIDKAILDKSDIVPGEKVQVLNFNNGQRFETYVIEEKENSRIISLYGPAARQAQIGDKVCILSYVLVSDEGQPKIKPKLVLLDKENKVIS